MSALQSSAAKDVELAPLVDDLSTYLISGRVKSHFKTDEKYETMVRTPSQGIADGVAAERLGFRRVFLSERYDLKEAGALLGGIGALTSRIGLATGVIGATSRHPLLAAALGATLHAAYGPRFVYGIGRGAAGWNKGTGITENSFDALVDYADMLYRLWRGESVTYNGPAGSYEKMALADCYEGPAPEIWYGSYGLPKAAKAAATRAFSGVLLPAMFTPDGVRSSVKRIREACERIGRDPSTLRICASVVTAPELDEFETRALCHARAVTYLQPPAWGYPFHLVNGWDLEVIKKLQAHALFSRMKTSLADTSFHRVDLLEPARLIPDTWMQESCAIGSITDCVRRLQAFKDAGADEITTYGSTPGQNTKLIAAWREHSAARQGGSPK